MTNRQDLLQTISNAKIFSKALAVTVRNLQKLIVDMGSLAMAKLGVAIVQAHGIKVQQWGEFERVVKGPTVNKGHYIRKR